MARAHAVVLVLAIAASIAHASHSSAATVLCAGACLQQRSQDAAIQTLPPAHSVPDAPQATTHGAATNHPMPRALRGLAQPSAAKAAPKTGRQLQQVAGLANFMVGLGIQGSQQAINAGGALAQLSNFYGVEGLGMRHRLGALPAPGGLELMALGGPLALPGPEGMSMGWLGGTIEALAASANPLTALTLGQVAQDAASSSGLGNLAGATGLSGLGLGTGLAATALSNGAGLGSLGTEALGSGAGGALGMLGAAGGLGAEGTLGAAANMLGMGGSVGGLGSSAAGTMMNGASQMPGTVASNAGALKGAAASLGKDVASTAASGAGGLFNTAGKFLGRLSDLAGPGSKNEGDGLQVGEDGVDDGTAADGSNLWNAAAFGTTVMDTTSMETTSFNSEGSQNMGLASTSGFNGMGNVAGVSSTANSMLYSGTAGVMPSQQALPGTRMGTQQSSTQVSVTGPFPDMAAAVAMRGRN